MSELTIMIEQQGKMIAALQKQIHDLSLLMMKYKVSNTWMDEETAASMVGYNPVTFRRKVKDAHKIYKEPWCLINYRHSNGRNFQYSRKSMIEFQRRTSIDQ